MILQTVKPTIQPLGIGYANRPKKAQNGGYVVFSHIYACLALILQPLRGDSIAFSKPTRREADSQPISQSGSQSGKQAGRQAGRVKLFSLGDHVYKQWGTCCA